MAELLNPTKQSIAGRYDGGSYLFKPGERREILDGHVARHLLHRWGKYGLVDITFDRKASESFGSAQAYEHAQKIAGVETLMYTLEEKISSFAVAIDEFGERPHPVKNQYKRNQKTAEKQLEDTKKFLATLEATSDEDLIKLEEKALQDQIARLEEKKKALQGTEKKKVKG